MTDEEMIKRLRDRTFLSGSLEELAADRIEELERERDGFKEAAETWLGSYCAENQRWIDVCEKLENAVEALRIISQFNAVTNSALNVHSIFKMTDRARTALAKLEGGE